MNIKFFFRNLNINTNTKSNLNTYIKDFSNFHKFKSFNFLDNNNNINKDKNIKNKFNKENYLNLRGKYLKSIFPNKNSFLKSTAINNQMQKFSLFNFCNLARINFDKLEVNKDKENYNDIENQLIKDEEDLKKKEATKAFSLDDNIIEFSPDLNWEEVVMKSQIPVLVDCYAE
jgi:hypothetical protein